MSLSILIGSSIFSSLVIEVAENFDVSRRQFSIDFFDVDKSSGSRTSD